MGTETIERPAVQLGTADAATDVAGRRALAQSTSAGADSAGRPMDALRRIVRGLRVSSSRVEQQLGFSSAQLFALRQIATHPGASIGEVAACTVTNASTVSEVITRLVDRGLVERRVSVADRRRAELFPTAKARVVLAEAPDTAQERLVAGFAKLPAEDRIALVHALEAWLEVSALSGEPATMFFEPLDARGDG